MYSVLIFGLMGCEDDAKNRLSALHKSSGLAQTGVEVVTWQYHR